MTQREPWREFKYKYENPGFLRFLVDILGEKGVVANAYMCPNELDGELEDTRRKFFRMGKEEFERNFESYLQFYSKLREHGIIPGMILKFDYSFGQNDGPKIEQLIPYRREQYEGYSEKLRGLLMSPANFIGKRWEGISFESFFGEQSIRNLKKSVEMFSNEGYSLVQVRANLNPQPYTSDHYHDGVDYDGHLFAGGGNMEISGNFPEDFDFSRFIPKRLPERQKMLDQLCLGDW